MRHSWLAHASNHIRLATSQDAMVTILRSAHAESSITAASSINQYACCLVYHLHASFSGFVWQLGHMLISGTAGRDAILQLEVLPTRRLESKSSEQLYSRAAKCPAAALLQSNLSCQ